MEAFVAIARITKTRGIRGEVAAEILTDFPYRFSRLDRVCLSTPDGFLHWETIEHHWFHKNRVILKFLGRDTPEQVRDLIGSELVIREEERVALPEGTYFDDDLIGCEIYEAEERLGSVRKVFKMADEAVNLVVEAEDGSEFMIPLVCEFVNSVDVGDKRIEVRLPPGLRELAVGGSKKA